MPNLNAPLPLAINLHGLNLIEASAGTGKTYTLTILYLRLLIERRLDPARILVVTFTTTATEALRERVRQQLVTALAAITNHAGDHTTKDLDPLLRQILNAAPNQDTVKNILVDALARMDEAAIYTIHGFCRRMLQDHAFESGASFGAELITNETPLRQIAARDVWRCRLANASLADTTWIRSHWQDPDALLNSLGSILNNNALRILPQLDAATVAEMHNAITAKLAQLRSTWVHARTEIEGILRDSPALNRRSYTKPIINNALAAMDLLVAGADLPSEFPKACERLSTRMLQEEKSCKAGATPPYHPFFALYAEIEQDLAKLPRWRKALWIQEARTQISTALHTIKRDNDVVYFDDLLKNLDQALADTQTGGSGHDLAAAIRNRFPVALIDEFQDTDPEQYRIFHQIYQNYPDCGLFLIGDPKQAIYSFRGADIFTYMQAKSHVAPAKAEYTLDTNWRSGSRLVTAVNAIFSNIPTPFIYADIPFKAVAPSPQADKHPLVIDGQEPIPLQFWLIKPTAATDTVKQTAEVLLKPVAEAKAARACAEYIAELLLMADAGRVKLGAKPLQPKDIAILVRKRKEGELMQDELRHCNVNSVTLSEDSVFTTEQAAELTGVLEAVARPGNVGLLRAALATVMFGWNAAQIDALYKDVASLEAILARFQDYHTLWLERGFMVFFQLLLQQEAIPARLLQRPDGERWLTNLLQLAELLQSAAVENVGITGLLYWFVTQQAADDTAANAEKERQMRLESDAGLVKILTIHTSKGLEYPVVFIPFPWSIKPHHKPQLVLFHATTDSVPCLDLGSDAQAQNKELQRLETMAEDARLFYVALTRAANLCILCWWRVNNALDSAPAWLLHPDPLIPATSRLKSVDKNDEAGIESELAALASRVPGCIEIRDLPAPRGSRWTGPKLDPTRLQAREFTGKIDYNWSVASYSGLVRDDDHGRPDHADAPVAILESPAAISADVAAPLDTTNLTIPALDTVEPADTVGTINTVNTQDFITPIDPIFAFPAGAEAGLCLHELLEHLDFPTASGDILNLAIQATLPNYPSLSVQVPEGVTDWGTVAADIITNCLDTPLTATTAEGEVLRLRDINWHNRLSEIEFHYPLAHLTPQALNAALAPFPAYQDCASNLTFKPCQGLMHGFVDLVFRHQGRYYLADYKSNRLGTNLTDYDRNGMYQAMREHRYDLQYLVYAVALHRFLGQRLPGYTYEQNFGGAYYLFLRGMRPAHGPAYGVYFDRPPLQVIVALEALFASSD